jgi:hypothetical protein
MVAIMVMSPGIVDFLAILSSVIRDSKHISPDVYAKIALVQANALQPRSTSKHRVRLKDLRDLDYVLARVDATRSHHLFCCIIVCSRITSRSTPRPSHLPPKNNRSAFCFDDPRVLNRDNLTGTSSCFSSQMIVNLVDTPDPEVDHVHETLVEREKHPHRRR